MDKHGACDILSVAFDIVTRLRWVVPQDSSSHAISLLPKEDTTRYPAIRMISPSGPDAPAHCPDQTKCEARAE